MLSPRYSTFCLTLSHGLAPADALGRYGVDPAAARAIHFPDAVDLPRDNDVSVLRAGIMGEWTFCIELFGVQGSLSHILENLSSNTDTLSIMAAESLTYFEHWRQGHQLESFEPGTTEALLPNKLQSFRKSIQRRTTAASDRPALLAAMDVVSDHIGDLTLTESDLDGPLLTALLPWSLTEIQPSPPLTPEARSTLGRCLGTFDPTELGQGPGHPQS